MTNKQEGNTEGDRRVDDGRGRAATELLRERFGKSSQCTHSDAQLWSDAII